jgi:GNAT superfamily N-acetyltransferase
MSDPGVRVVEAGAERIGDLEPIWRALYEHHREISAGVAKVRPYEATWRQRQGQYRGWLGGEEAAVLLIAERGERAVGYAFLTAGPGAATWDFGDRAAELETLAVLADERGGGVGAALVDQGRRWARERGVTAIGVGLAHTNEDARRFYEREGWRLFYLEMVLDLRSR